MFRSMFLRTCALGLSGALVFGRLSLGSSGDAPPQYNRDVRPILAENCFACHGPDSAARKADLRLDKREAAIEAGAIAPGKLDESELVKRILSTDPEEVMPPPATHKVLKPEQIDVLKRWVAAGAEYQLHWSFLAPVRPPAPAVRQESWPKGPLDRFVLARLEQAGLQPAAEADRRTLARRASFDLIGLPPAPEIVEAFLADPAADAYERYVDRLLATPQWGEHRARTWLDAARYADTHGIHFDNYREMWSYRDWVIGAFNRNLPFDQFTIEQLAGDLLPDRTLEQQVASGFNRCNMTTNEGGAISEEYSVLYTRDRVETTSQVFMGLTAGCAVCHDHKFDPLSQREFYELAAFFNNTTQNAMDGNIKDTPPIVFVPQTEDRPRWDALAAELPLVRKQLEDRKQAARPDYEQWVAGAAAAELAALVPNDGLRVHAALSEGSGNSVNMTLDGQARALSASAEVGWEPGHVARQTFHTRPGVILEIADAGDFEKDQPYSAGAWVKLSRLDQVGSVVARMDDRHDYRGWDLWIENGKVGAHIIHKWDEDAIKSVSNATIKANEWTHLMVTYDGSGKAAGLKIYFNGVPQPASAFPDRLNNTIRATVPLKIGQRDTTSPLDAAIQDVRIYGRSLDAGEVSRLALTTRAAWLAAKPPAERSEQESGELLAWYLATIDKPTQQFTGRLAQLEQEEAGIKARGTQAHVMQERPEPAAAFTLYRGEYDKRRDSVTPGVPQVLPPLPADYPKNRLGFARWLLLPENPLTARVTVNRFWQEVFGTGLVRTAGDFGVSGETPSHPELLDWLAVEFRESGWDVKHLFRLMVTSAAYRQAAIVTPEKLEKDGANRLLSRGPRFRMDAEMVRDAALASSGLLVPKIGGPSVRPYQPDGVWEAVAMIGSNTRDYVRDRGDSLYRRSLYTFWKRAAPPASMDVFNAPSREICTVRRERTNTPLQALVTLNDPQFVEAARFLAQQALQQPGGAGESSRFDFIALRLLARPWHEQERPVVAASLSDLLAYYQAHADEARQLLQVGDKPSDPALDPAALAAWTMLTNELMNLDEVLNK